MPVDDRDDERPSADNSPSTPRQTDDARAETATPGGEGVASSPVNSSSPVERRRAWRRVVNRRNAMWTGLVAVVAVVALVVIFAILYRFGQVDNLIAGQVVSTLAKYGVRAEVGSFETKFGPRTAELRDLKLYDAATGAQLGKIDRVLATVRVEDMWALSLRRNVNLEALEIDGLELRITFDEEGRSNFANLRLPPEEENKRLAFSYATATVKLNNAVVHFDDQRHDISGEAKNLRAIIQPDEPAAPAESRMNRVELSFSDSTFVYDGRPVERISLDARGRVNQTRAEIQELVLRSPVAEARLEGVLDDWRAMRYRMNLTSMVDLTQASDILRTGTTLRGVGNVKGTVTGEGANYRFEGEGRTDALAADGVRLKGLNVTAKGTGEGASYEAQGRAVAELLTAGDFQLNTIQVAGGVMGTGTDFKWLGELRAAARYQGTTIAGLILSDAAAEFRDEKISGGAKRVTAQNVRTDEATLSGVEASGVEFKQNADDSADVSASSVRAGSVVASGATVKGVTASGVTADIAPSGAAQVAVERVTVGGVNAAGAQTGSLNIAGVRLSIRDGRVEGSSGDVNVGTVAFQTGAKNDPAGRGRAENVRLARPVFVLEPSGRYRASADLSLGGGVLGTMNLGAARAAVVATNDAVQLNNFTADVFGGRASGNATVATNNRAASRVAAEFAGVDVGGLVSTFSGRVVPLTGGATGAVNLSFPGTNFKAASGTLNAQFSGETGNEAAGRTPLSGDVAVRAERGLFRVERANLKTAQTELSASGQFSFEGESNLDVSVASNDASELQRVLVSSGLAPEIEESLNNYGVALAGNLEFRGNLTGQLDNPLVNGRASLSSLVVRGQDLGSVSADIASNVNEVRITNGQLAERDGGGVSFDATIPRAGQNNVAFNATLDRANAGNIVAAVAGGASSSSGGEKKGFDPASLAGLGSASGRIEVAGLPNAMSGKADLRVGPGSIGGEPFEEIVANATFDGSEINVAKVDARLRSGRIEGSGKLGMGVLNPEAATNQRFEIRASGKDVNLNLVASLAGAGSAAPPLTGFADFTANAEGNFYDTRSYKIDLNAKGRDVVVNGQRVEELSLVGRTTEDRKFNVELTTNLITSGTNRDPLVLRAQIDLNNDELPLTFKTTLDATDLSRLFATLLPASNVRVTGRATGFIEASGRILGDEGILGEGGLGALRGRAEFTDLAVQIEDITLNAEQPLVVLFSPNEVVFEKTRFTGPGTNILFGGTAALREGGRQNFTVDGDLNLRVLNNISPDVFLAGTAKVGVRIAGTYADPKLTGTADVSGASFSTLLSDERLSVTNIDGRVRFTANQAQIDNLTGRIGGGRVAVTGGAVLVGLRPSPFRLVVRADNVSVPFPDDFRSTADANLELRGTLDAQIIEGFVNLRRTEYTRDFDLADFLEDRRDIEISRGTGGSFASNAQLDLQVEGRDALVIRNNLADTVGSVSLRIRGSADDPVVSGRVTATNGTMNFRNNRYEIQRALIELPPQRGADPVLNVQAESEIRGYRVTVNLSGPLAQGLQVSVRSDPALPQADVVSLITTGDLASGDQSQSSLAQTGIGTATSLLTDTLINAPVQRATDRLFGLNRFEIDPLIAGRGGASPTARLTVGRQINRNLSVTYSTNVTSDQNQVVAVEYRVSDRLSFVARYQQGAVNSFRPQANDFNFEIRFRKRF